MKITLFILGSFFSILSAIFVILGMGGNEPTYFGLAVLCGLYAIHYYLKEAAMTIREALEK